MSRETFQRWCREGFVVATRSPKGQYRVTLNAISDLVQSMAAPASRAA